MAEHSTQEVEHLKGLIRVLNDGIEFYRDAEEKVADASLKRTFERMATTKEKLVNRLQPYIVLKEGDHESGHTLVGRARELYAQVRGALSTDSGQAYISSLEELEDTTLEEMRDAIKHVQNVEVVAALREFQPQLKQCHDEMRALKQRH